MKTFKLFSSGGRLALAAALFLAAAGFTRAATLWSGPTNGFYQPYLGQGDEMTTNVIITRGSGGGLYNSVLESGATAGISPAGTEWAVGFLTNDLNVLTNLSYGSCPLEEGNRPPNYIGTTFVVHLITDDVYLQLTLTNWGGAGGTSGEQTFGYTRSTPATVVTITNPLAGAVFTAPANVNISASATNTIGLVTNVQFFANNVSVGSATSAPFSVTASNLAAGVYALTAVATPGLFAATSSVVNITVQAPLSTPVVTITNPINGSVFAAPANVHISASATNSSGPVTNVQFFVNNASVGSLLTVPFTLTTGSLTAGPYSLTAVAASGGLLATSAVVNITVVNPFPIALSPPTLLSGPTFQFSYAANVGLSYVVQRSTSVQSVDWVSLATNVAASDPAVFVDSPATNSAAYYRVGRLPNP